MCKGFFFFRRLDKLLGFLAQVLKQAKMGLLFIPKAAAGPCRVLKIFFSSWNLLRVRIWFDFPK